jgi:hypothetical protein
MPLVSFFFLMMMKYIFSLIFGYRDLNIFLIYEKQIIYTKIKRILRVLVIKTQKPESRSITYGLRRSL